MPLIPNTTPEEALQLLSSVYGALGTATRLPAYKDDNFVIAEPDGSRSILKVMHPDSHADEVELPVALLGHLGNRGGSPGCESPRVLPTSTGAPVARITDVQGRERWVWRLGWIEGRLMADVRPRSRALLSDLGRALGGLAGALEGFDHPAAGRDHDWDLARADWLGGELGHVEDPARRELLEPVVRRYQEAVRPRLDALRTAVIHGDANDHNVLVEDIPEPGRVTGLLDFGDAVRAPLVCEPAIAMAYAMFEQDDPIGAGAALVAGFHERCPLSDEELDVMVGLAQTRFAMSVIHSARRGRASPEDPYTIVSEAQAWETLERLATVHPRLATARVRVACGRPATPMGPAVRAWLEAPDRPIAPVLGRPLGEGELAPVDLGVGSPMLGADPAHLETGPCGSLIEGVLAAAGAEVGLGLYDEARAIYLGPEFCDGDHPTDEHRTIHIGIDLFAPAGTPVHAPLAGRIASAGENATPKDYGPVLLLEHETGGGERFYTLYGHLERASLEGAEPGRTVEAGERIAAIGAPDVNGDWPPHLHLQVVLDPFDRGHDVPGVAAARERDVWLELCPDPSVLAGLEPGAARAVSADPDKLLTRRRGVLGPNLSVSYRRPLCLVRGWRQFAYDETGRAYLDLYNNVPHVGHSHPRVVRAVQEQIALLNTNTRYLHEGAVRYAERLSATLPDPLGVVYLLSSASEANELALRLARARTGREDLVVLEHGYHGHTTALIDASSYKFDGPGGRGRRPWVHVAPIPDGFRGRHRGSGTAAGAAYAAELGDVLSDLDEAGTPPAAFLAETLPSVGGHIVPPQGYLADAYARVRAHGAVCVADEVQTGLGRLGEAFWGFELLGAVPDVVVLGKPIGNGFPLAAVVTTADIAADFDNGMEFFSTFGGSPVACAAGLAVLDVLDQEALPARAGRLGARLLEALGALQEDHPLIGDVRGAGLFIGVELVRDRETLEPAGREARYVSDRLRERGILIGTDGPHDNVLKLRGPLVVEEADVERLVDVLSDVLRESALSG